MQIAWITGASSGIGKSVADYLEVQNYSVKRLTRSDFDLINEDQIAKWLISNSETPDLLVCNAGINQVQNLENFSKKDFNKVFDSNFTGHANLTLDILPRMVKNGGGRIVFISSAYSAKARIGRFPYSASKVALDAFMKSIAVEYAGKNILANSVAPGFIETELTKKNNSSEEIIKILSRIPLNKLGLPEDVAQLVAYLGSRSNNYITGQIINIDGGFSIT